MWRNGLQSQRESAYGAWLCLISMAILGREGEGGGGGKSKFEPNF